MPLEWLRSLVGLISKERLKEPCMYNLAKWQVGLEAKKTVYKYLKSINQACKTQSSATLGKWEIWVTALHTAHWPVLPLSGCLGEQKSSPGSVIVLHNHLESTPCRALRTRQGPVRHTGPCPHGASLLAFPLVQALKEIVKPLSRLNLFPKP